MSSLSLKANHKPVRDYYDALETYRRLGEDNEGTVSVAFQHLLESCGRQFQWTLLQQYQIKRVKKQPLRVDGALVDEYNLARGLWEAKDPKDDLKKEVQKKFAVGYPKDNIIFQQPDRAILYQDGKLIFDEDISKPQALVDVVKQFFDYCPPRIEQWQQAAVEFGDRVKEHAEALLALIREQEKINKQFIDAFSHFWELCKKSINPNLSAKAVEEMLIQHLLTERIFRSVFNNPDFARKNVIAVEIEKVIDALTSKHFSRSHFLSKLDRFYGAIEETAATIDDFSQKQGFLNTVYEKFFQGFSVKIADTHGIVYTPQPIVNFMVKSVEDILQREFGKSLVDKGVHILDPFVGTGNFILRIMQEIVQIQKLALPYKYEHDLHCNEVMLLPYYIASMNIEHEYYEQTGGYKSFDGICLVDTFEDQSIEQLSLFVPENMKRVETQRKSDIFVIIGNPPYNVGQLNENDNNKNRKYSNKDKTGIDDRVAATYAKASKATLVSSLRDPYVKAFRWSTDRISDEGLICFVTNNSYIDSLPFDGMRREILKDFNYIYSLNLQGDIRKDSMRDGIPLGEENTVFGLAAMVGVAITILVKKQGCIDRKIFYKEVNFRATREEKFSFLEESNSLKNIKWTNICPNEDHVWLTENLHSEFNDFLSIGKKLFQKNKTENSSIFKEFSPGVMTGRDFITFDFSIIQLSKKINDFCACYNTEVHKFLAEKEKKIIDIDSFVDYNNIKWSRNLKQQLKKGKTINFSETLIRESLSRPFTKQFLYFDDIIIDEIGKNCLFSPLKDNENKIILVTNHSQLPFLVQMTNLISSRDVGGRPGHCFPFFTYDKDGTNRQENITDWALETFRNHYQDQTITKWDIFHYTYAVLHHPHYRQRYAANLKRELPRIPFAPEFWPFAIAGKRLAEIHVNYEQQPEYRLKHLENKDLPIDWRVEKMRLSKDKTQIKYNEFLTLTGIPLEVFEYRLGNRSALDWIIDQYQIKTDKRSGIVNDPNRLDDEEYIVRLIKQVITISLETVQIVKNLPDLGLPKD